MNKKYERLTLMLVGKEADNSGVFTAWRPGNVLIVPPFASSQFFTVVISTLVDQLAFFFEENNGPSKLLLPVASFFCPRNGPQRGSRGSSRTTPRVLPPPERGQRSSPCEFGEDLEVGRENLAE